MTAATADLIREAHGFGAVAPDLLLVDFPSLGALLEMRSLEQPDALFLKYFDDDSGETAAYSYAQFSELVLRAATLLVSRGLRAGDCFATLSHNHPIAAALLFAGWKLGLLVAPLNASEDDGRIAFVLLDADAKLIIAHPALRERACRITAGAAGAAPMTQNVLTLDDLPASSDGKFVEGDYRRHPALIVYTSGTTGKPKGVALTQYNMMINAQGIAAWHSLDASKPLMCVLPIHHVNGIVVTLVTTVMAGSAVILNRGFKASTFWRHLAAERVAIVSVVPTILQFLFEANEDISGLDLSQFRYFICGAGTLPILLVEKFEARFGLSILHGYGLSETTAFTCTLPAGLPQDVRKHWLCDHGYPSIGAVFPHCEMAIHDADGHGLPANERGEIVIRGHYIMDGYHHRPDANADAFKHGWFRSGDEGFFEIDELGRAYYFITGRLKELINRGGVKYSPFEIEEVLLTIPGVKAGVAIAFENDWYGEEIGAYVVRDADSAISSHEIIKACRVVLPFAKCPKVVVFGDDIPVTVTGKYQRLKLAPLFSDHQKTQFRD